MATTTYFEEEIRDQGGKHTMELEFGRSSYYPEDSLYLTVNGESVIVDRKTAKRIFDAMAATARYFGLDE